MEAAAISRSGRRATKSRRNAFTAFAHMHLPPAKSAPTRLISFAFRAFGVAASSGGGADQSTPHFELGEKAKIGGKVEEREGKERQNAR